MNLTIEKPATIESAIAKRRASVVWRGTLREGAGSMSTESGVLNDMQYSFRTRFLDKEIGTNPDELIAAALGGCFSMGLANELGLSGFQPERIETTATATMENLTAGWTITQIQLDVHAHVPSLSQADFHVATTAAKLNCPVCRLLNTNVSLTATLN